MKLETFAMERLQSTWENRVAWNVSESGVHPLRVERHQRRDEHEAHHVDETDDHQDRQPLHRLAPIPSTTALTTISTTPNAAATPVSESRRLDRISMEMGLVSYV